MIIVTYENIRNLGLPLDTTEKILLKGDLKRVLKRLEKSYGLKSHFVCRKIDGKYLLYANAAYSYVPEDEKSLWVENYERYVKASLVYKMLIFLQSLQEMRR